MEPCFSEPETSWPGRQRRVAGLFQKQELYNHQLGDLVPGDSEKRLADVLRPQDLTFLEHGIVMAYPKYSVEFLVSDNKIQALQQPSFLQIARAKPALFYAPNTTWSSCTPEKWVEAVPAAPQG